MQSVMYRDVVTLYLGLILHLSMGVASTVIELTFVLHYFTTVVIDIRHICTLEAKLRGDCFFPLLIGVRPWKLQRGLVRSGKKRSVTNVWSFLELETLGNMMWHGAIAS